MYLLNSEFYCPSGLNGLPYKDDQLFKQNIYLRKKVHTLENDLKIRFPHDWHNIVDENNDKIPEIYVITPTYSRHVQKAELVRLSHTFKHVPKLHWIIIEDSDKKTSIVTDFLNHSNLKHTHLHVKTPENMKIKDDEPQWLKHKGVLQRNEGLNWIRSNAEQDYKPGVVFFADDDNTYSLKVFEEMRYTKKMSVWPVGLVGKLLFESPLVEHGKVIGWRTFWKPDRLFASDMAGFAINLHLFFKKPTAKFNVFSERGELESDLIKDLGINLSDLEPRANNCTEILVWHTRTENPNLKNEIYMNEDSRLLMKL